MFAGKIRAAFLLLLTLFVLALTQSIYGQDPAKSGQDTTKVVPKAEVDAVKLIAVERELIEARYKLAKIDFDKLAKSYADEYARLTAELNTAKDALFKKHGIDPVKEDVELSTGKVVPLKE